MPIVELVVTGCMLIGAALAVIALRTVRRLEMRIACTLLGLGLFGMGIARLAKAYG